MKRFISYGKIPQLNQVTRDIAHVTQYVGYNDVEGCIIMDKTKQLPTLTFVGTEKIHGTNASVCYSTPDGFWVQSRNKIITPEDDNNGCATAAMEAKEAWMEIIRELAYQNDINLNTHIISVYYEWAGGNIQKLSALSGIEKKAIIFSHFKVSPLEPVLGDSGEEKEYAMHSTGNYRYSSADIYNINTYPSVSVDINFEEPKMCQNKLLELVAEVEKASPVGKSFDKESNIGEGYVFTCFYKNKLHRFKAKGEEHAKSTGKVKTIAPVDEEAERIKAKFVNEKACVIWRLEQMFDETEAETQAPLTSQQTGIYLQKVFADIAKEESIAMEELDLTSKAINGMVAKVARSYFNSRIM